MSSAKTDPHRLPSVRGAEARQAAKAQYIPAGAVAGILLFIIAVVLLAALG